MGLEFGKWLMDVAKYMLTALLLASFFRGYNSTCGIHISQESRKQERRQYIFGNVH